MAIIKHPRIDIADVRIRTLLPVIGSSFRSAFAKIEVPKGSEEGVERACEVLPNIGVQRHTTSVGYVDINWSTEVPPQADSHPMVFIRRHFQGKVRVELNDPGLIFVDVNADATLPRIQQPLEIIVDDHSGQCRVLSKLWSL
jgi:hypothetical protein